MSNADIERDRLKAELNGRNQDNCPDCGKPLQPRWYGLDACFCLWGGRKPTVDQILATAIAGRWN